MRKFLVTLLLALFMGTTVSCMHHGSKPESEPAPRTTTGKHSGVTLRLPVSWEPTADGAGDKVPFDLYIDPATPQYNFIVSELPVDEGFEQLVQRAGALSAPLTQMLQGNPYAKNLEVEEVAPGRALAYYLGTAPDPVHGRKDDRHWVLLVTGGAGSVRIATFTLSVLADHANAHETEVLVQVLSESIAACELSTR